jgi:hypothetical protein
VTRRMGGYGWHGLRTPSRGPSPAGLFGRDGSRRGAARGEDDREPDRDRGWKPKQSDGSTEETSPTSSTAAGVSELVQAGARSGPTWAGTVRDRYRPGLSPTVVMMEQ